MFTNTAPPVLVELAREECLRLLNTASVGRVVVLTPEGTPVIRPVNYAFDPTSQSVVFRCSEGTKLVTLLRAAHAWFEVDEIDPAGATGWSVIIAGVTQPITRPEDVKRLDACALHSWAAARTAQWIRIRTRVVSGRRIDASVAVTDSRP